jgi:hypothetical protein
LLAPITPFVFRAVIPSKRNEDIEHFPFDQGGSFSHPFGVPLLSHQAWFVWKLSPSQNIHSIPSLSILWRPISAIRGHSKPHGKGARCTSKRHDALFLIWADLQDFALDKPFTLSAVIM